MMPLAANNPRGQMTKSLPWGVFSCLFAVLLATSVQAEKPDDCGNNNQAQQLAYLIKHHQNQQRTQLDCHAKLTDIGHYKAKLLSGHEVIMHNIGHLTPNQLLRKKGYKLSDGYPHLGNQVEAIAAGNKTASETFNQLLNSARHRNLILGSSDFYREQNQIGVAYLQQKVSPYEHYWVIYLADTKHREKPKTEFTVSYDYTLHHEKSAEQQQKLSIRKRHEQSRHKHLMPDNQ
ncbi:MAG: CAP domain-containing protein [Proteobacteria bacterium]|nr:MAG: CAP domain-containing protein [Pseudomonadota bacterium]